MTSQLIPLSFESHEVRAFNIDGNPWFVGKDVCDVLGYANAADAIKQHCRGVAKYYPIVDRLGRTQEVRIINEPDLYRVIVGSEKPEAERFERWVFEDVLPTIRKTGSYTVPHARSAPDTLMLRHQRAKCIAATWLSMAKLFGTDVPMARAIAADQVRQYTGLDPTPLLAGNTVQEAPMTPTELGRIINVSARKINALLALQGFQEKHTTTPDWVPTAKGKPYCTCNPYKSPHSQHTGYRTLWYRTVLDVLNYAQNEVESVA